MRKLWPANTYSPITAASISRPPNRLYSRNFTAAYERRAPTPRWCRSVPMTKYIGMSMTSKNT